MSTGFQVRAAKESALEAETIGVDIIGDLHSQRETILRSQGHLRDIDSGLVRSMRSSGPLNTHLKRSQQIQSSLRAQQTYYVSAVFPIIRLREGE